MSNRIKESAPEIARPKHREDVQSRLVDGEIVILDYDGGFIHQLNGTATFIWEKCDGQLTAVEIASQVCQAFEIDETTALKDVLDTLRDLQKLSLVTDC